MTPDELKQRFPTLTKHFKAKDLTVFADKLRPASWPSGESLTRFDQRSETLHLITSGSISIHVEQNGEDLLLGQAGAGCVVGELGLVEPGPSSATLTALEDVTTLDMSHATFEALCKESPATASALLRSISHELVHRLRNSSRDILRRIDDHHWMRVRAQEDKKGWLARIASLVRGGDGGEG
jgi:CRP-like cAMP-binding protein